jgi:hypothetical protein
MDSCREWNKMKGQEAETKLKVPWGYKRCVVEKRLENVNEEQSRKKKKYGWTTSARKWRNFVMNRAIYCCWSIRSALQLSKPT